MYFNYDVYVFLQFTGFNKIIFIFFSLIIFTGAFILISFF